MREPLKQVLERTEAGVSVDAAEKSWVAFSLGLARDQHRQFASVVIPPHGALAIRDLLTRRDVVPAVGPVVDGVQEQALMVRVGRKIRLIEECVG